MTDKEQHEKILELGTLVDQARKLANQLDMKYTIMSLSAASRIYEHERVDMYAHLVGTS